MHTALGILAMGDVNATTLGQAAHVSLLRQDGGLTRHEPLPAYRRPAPRGKVGQGLMQDDHAVRAIVRRRARRTAPASKQALELVTATRAAHVSAGTSDVPAKRRVDVPNAAVQRSGGGRAAWARRARAARPSAL